MFNKHLKKLLSASTKMKTNSGFVIIYLKISPSVTDKLRGKTSGSIWTAGVARREGLASGPAHALRECLTGQEQVVLG
jgi:hypothetical protein